MKKSRSEQNDLNDALRGGNEDNKRRSARSKAKDSCDHSADSVKERSGGDTQMGYIDSDTKAKDCCKPCRKRKDDGSQVSDCSMSGDKKKTKSASKVSDCNMCNSASAGKKHNAVSDCNTKGCSDTSEGKRRTKSAR